MVMTKDQIFKVVEQAGRPGIGGLAAAIRRPNKNPMGGSGLPRSQEDFLSAAEQVPDNKGQRLTYNHPGALAQMRSSSSSSLRQNAARATGQPEEPVSLTQAQIAWLQRLPTDPTQVTFDDAVELLRLLNEVDNPSDVGLVRMIAAPVKEYHDREAAEVELHNARLPHPDVPGEALPALADALRPDLTQLADSELLHRA